jgi:putative tributyrin esterase
MRFRTFEISDPRFESDGLREITFKSAALRGRADVTVYAPAGAEGAPIVILLHGVYGSHWAWTRSGGAHKTAARLIAAGEIKPMILAMPSDGLLFDGSGYVAHNGRDFEKYIVDEVPSAVRQGIPGAGEKMFISGLSMGGFGALRLGAKYPTRFAGISAHSAITHFSQLSRFVEEPLSMYGAIAEEEQSALHFIQENREKLPPLRFDCGVEDVLISENRELHAALVERAIAHEYAEFPGAHNWDYWHAHLEKTLRFFSQYA